MFAEDTLGKLSGEPEFLNFAQHLRKSLLAVGQFTSAGKINAEQRDDGIDNHQFVNAGLLEKSIFDQIL